MASSVNLLVLKFMTISLEEVSSSVSLAQKGKNKARIKKGKLKPQIKRSNTERTSWTMLEQMLSLSMRRWEIIFFCTLLCDQVTYISIGACEQWERRWNARESSWAGFCLHFSSSHNIWAAAHLSCAFLPCASIRTISRFVRAPATRLEVLALAQGPTSPRL